MSIKVGDRRRFHNDGFELAGEPHTVTCIEAERGYVVYVYDSGDQAYWRIDGDDTAGGYEECTEEVTEPYGSSTDN